MSLAMAINCRSPTCYGRAGLEPGNESAVGPLAAVLTVHKLLTSYSLGVTLVRASVPWSRFAIVVAIFTSMTPIGIVSGLVVHGEAS